LLILSFRSSFCIGSRWAPRRLSLRTFFPSRNALLLLSAQIFPVIFVIPRMRFLGGFDGIGGHPQLTLVVAQQNSFFLVLDIERFLLQLQVQLSLLNIIQQGVATREKSLEAAQRAYQDGLNETSNTNYDEEAERQKALDALDKLKDDMQSKERLYDDAVYALRIFKKYTYPNTLTDKENKLIQTRLNYEKIKVSTASKVVQKENEINKIENELRKSKKELERIESYLPMMEIKAPVDGILVYGDIGRQRERSIEIELGMEVKRKRVVATIPEMENLIVNFELPEQFLHRVEVGSKAFISPDAMPTLKLLGKVDEIAVVPVNQISWDRTSPKVYHSVIALDAQSEDFVSGMNVQVEIVEDTIVDAVNVPVEAVFEEEGEYYVFLKSGSKASKKVVELGKSNDQYVHIVEGLEEGDLVYLFSPYELAASE